MSSDRRHFRFKCSSNWYHRWWRWKWVSDNGSYIKMKLKIAMHLISPLNALESKLIDQHIAAWWRIHASVKWAIFDSLDWCITNLIVNCTVRNKLQWNFKQIQNFLSRKCTPKCRLQSSAIWLWSHRIGRFAYLAIMYMWFFSAQKAIMQQMFSSYFSFVML